MGYKRATYLLVFDDPQYEGLEIKTRGASIGQVTQMLDLMKLSGIESVTKEDLTELEKLWRLFAGCPASCDWAHEEQGGNCFISKIKSWNLEDEDGEGCTVQVPPTYAGFMEQDLGFQMAVAFAWLDAVLGTPGELGKGSTSGGPSPEASLPMEVLSLAPLS